jgi:AAA domain
MSVLSFKEIPLEGEQISGRLPVARANKTPPFVNLKPYLEGSIVQEVPSVSPIGSEKFLFYSGRLNEIHAEPATGKTNILMAATLAELALGKSVLYIDPEDTPQGFVARMRSLGADSTALAEQVFYLHNPSPEEIIEAQEWASIVRPSLVILDGLAESMSAQGKNEDKAQEVLEFFRINLRPFAESGSAVVVADHVTKSSEGRGQFARGSGAKAGRYDGVSYEIVAGVPYTPTDEGFVKLKIQKDRNGGAGRRGDIHTQLHFSPQGNGRTILTFKEPEKSNDKPWRPTQIIEKILNKLEVCGECSKTELRKVGKSETVDKAIEILLNEKSIAMKKDGKSHLYHVSLNSQCPCP